MYTQNDEEKVILDFFNGKIGTFADIGANDGITFSNTRKLLELGWKGIFVEPSPAAYFRLKDNIEKYEDAYCYNFAIGEHNHDTTFKQSGAILGSDVGLVSTFVDEEMNRFKHVTSYVDMPVRVFRWKTFYNRLRIKNFDFFSIDVEGMEAIILKQLDKVDYNGAQLVCVEWNSKPENRVEYDKYLSKFKVIHTTAENLIYAR